MKIKAIIEVIAALLVLMLIGQFSPSSAQQAGCWDRIEACRRSDTGANNMKQCCSVLTLEITNDKECFCTIIKPFLDGNVTLGKAFTTYFSLCEITSSFQKLCTASSLPQLHTNVDEPYSKSQPSLSLPSRQHSEPSLSQGKFQIIMIVPTIAAPLVSVTIALIIVFCIRHILHKRKGSFVSIDVEYGAANNNNNVQPPFPSEPQTPTEYSVLEFKNDFATAMVSLQYDKGILQAATNNFSPENELGRGGFGVVYKGILADGREIAVKRLSNLSSQGEKEFKNEVLLLAKLQHKNLVTLMGFCIADKEKLLVYDFMSNRSLNYFLFDVRNKGELDWKRRYNIIKGIARGMLYLHEDSSIRIIHRDLKAANVLLDAEMNPKIADFGLARVCAFEKTHVDTSRIAGTYGYMAPEYIFHGQFSIKSDVYSFGVLILEIISGKRVGEIYSSSTVNLNLLSYAWTCWLSKKPLELVDPSLGDSYSEDEVRNCIQLGLLCVQEEFNRRPNMVTIVHMLNNSVAAEMLSIMPHPPTYLSIS